MFAVKNLSTISFGWSLSSVPGIIWCLMLSAMFTLKLKVTSLSWFFFIIGK